MNIQASTTNFAAVSGANMPSYNVSIASDDTKNAASASTEDTLTISSQGLSLFKEAQSASQEALAVATDATTKDENSTLATVLDAVEEETTEDSDTVDSNDLSSYSDSQLRSLVADGKITQAEADTELANRKGKSEDKNETSSIAHVDIQI